MGCRTQFCTGGGCITTNTSVQAWCEAFGYTYDPNDPLASVYLDLIEQQIPTMTDSFKALCEACMRCRAVLYCNSQPGDAGSRSSIASSNVLGVAAGFSLQGASIATRAIGGAVGSVAGAAIPIVGAALDVVLGIFQHHAQAEAAQANALSQLTPLLSEAIYKADSAVAAGTATADDAVAFLQQTFASAKQAWSKLEKSCNAFCGYDRLLDLIASVTPQYYQILVVQSPYESSDTTNIPSGAVASSAPAPTASVLGSGAGITISSKTLIVLGVAAVGLVLLLSGGQRTVIVQGG